jgi:hypothetical protein
MFASNSTLSYHLKISSIFFTLFIIHYTAWFFGMGSDVGKDIAIACVAMFAVLVPFFIIKRPEMRITAFFILAYSALALLSPAVGWDARSIWLFHAKRIFLENNLFAQMDGYLVWSHNDYPVIIPSFSASLANIVGGWNEIFPKSASIIFLFPALTAISAIIASRFKVAIMLIFLIVVSNKCIANGYMDAVFAVYALLSVYAFGFALNHDNLHQRSATLFLLCSSLSLSVLVLIKNEGMMVIAGILCGAFIFSLMQKRLLPLAYAVFISVLPLILLAAWKYICKSNGISNDLLSSDLAATLRHRLSNMDEMLFIVKMIFFKPWMFFVLAASLVLVKLKKTDENFFIVLFCLFYISFLITAYVTTPHDIIWHIKTSLKRTIMPVSLLSFLALLNVYVRIHPISKLTHHTGLDKIL